MPLISIQQLADDVRIGLWQMTEKPAELYAQHPYLQSFAVEIDTRYKSEARKQEFLCVRALLHAMCPHETPVISHEPDGKPVLSNGWQLSISHTKGYAVLILSEHRTVGIDIEYMSDRVNRIAPKYIRPDECAPAVTDKLLNWSAKETAYKYYSADNLQYFDMRVTAQQAFLHVENLKRSVVLKVLYRVEPDYVLTYAYEELP